MIGEQKPSQRQRQLESRVTQLERAQRETQAQVAELLDEVAMFRHHLTRAARPTPPERQVVFQ